MIQSSTSLYENELLQNDDLPFLILKPDGEILYLNEAAIEFFENYYWEGQYFNMDEPSYIKWLSYIDGLIMSNTNSIDNFNVSLQNGVYLNITIQAEYHVSKHFITASILSYKETEFQVLNNGVNMGHRQLMQYVSKGIVITNEYGKIVDVNNCALILLNRKRDELMYKNHNLLFEDCEEYGTNVNQYLNKIKMNGHANQTMSYQVLNKKKVFLKYETIKEKDGKYLVTTISDETESKEMKSKLEHNGSLNTIGQMAASIAHEIRNPMTSLLGFTQLLKLEATEDASRYLSVIESELHRMDDILNEMLLLSKPKNKKIDDVDLECMLQDVISVMLPHASMNGCTFQLVKSTHEPLIIKGSLLNLKQVFINLLKNGLESMQNGGSIKLSINLSNDRMAEVCVQDEGIGMDDECMKKLFQPFQTTKLNGTGLGLPYVKDIVEEHEGHIHVESKVGRGTSFTLSFPLSQSYDLQVIV